MCYNILCISKLYIYIYTIFFLRLVVHIHQCTMDKLQQTQGELAVLVSIPSLFQFPVTLLHFLGSPLQQATYDQILISGSVSGKTQTMMVINCVCFIPCT